MNLAFADKICEVYRPGDIVMVHDYHLMLLPEMLRQRRPDIYVSFYLASPFPSSELTRCLPRRTEILEGILAADIIGFQASDYAQHFANSCARVRGFEATMKGVTTARANVPIAILPEGIDISGVKSLAFTEAVDAKLEELRQLYGGRRVIMGCDPPGRLGGVDKKVQVFSRFLERYPEWKEKVVLVQTNSRPPVEKGDKEESSYTEKVNELVNSVNNAHGSLGFLPVSLHSHQLSAEEYFALLRLGDLALITCAREGISTTGLEYVACQQDSHGQLIISEFSGTASSLEEALHINPWDIAGVAEQINVALTMSAERRQQLHQAVYRHLKQLEAHDWADNFIQHLVEVVQARG